MTSSLTSTRSGSQRAAVPEESKGELCVLLDCHGFLMAIPTRRVRRLLLYDEVAEPLGVSVVAGQGLVENREPSSDGAAAVHVDGQWWARWDLGVMVDQAPLAGAWVLMHVPHGGAELPIALATGACRVVAPVRSSAALPPGMFRARRTGLWAAFRAPRGGTNMPVGLCVDPLRLWTPPELQRSAGALLGVRAAGGRR